MQKIPITVAHGDGIGPAIMDATLKILQAAEAPLEYEKIEIGEKVYLQGNTSGIPQEAWDSFRRTKVFLKAPITTPQGKGYKSLNVTIRKTLGLYANVRPCISYHPVVETKHPVMDLVIVRENEEDLYAGIEHRQTEEVTQCLKLITKPGSEKIIRFAFEYAKAFGRKKVTCFSKDNIMKVTDGLFHGIFDQVGGEYPAMEKDHKIIDIGCALVADRPQDFDVLVTSNLYGDIMSDIAAQVSGSVGLCGSANLGENFAMFEAIHGSAPDIAGKGIANPSGLLLGAVQMLVYLGLGETATKVHNAWLKTLEDGIHTGDLFREGKSSKRVGTDEFADAVIERLGQRPGSLSAVDYPSGQSRIQGSASKTQRSKKELVGVDVFLDWDKDGRSPNTLGDQLREFKAGPFELRLISNRGVKVYPEGHSETFCTDHWRCRWASPKMEEAGKYQSVLELMSALDRAGFDVIKTENLYRFDGKLGFSLSQGE